MNHLAPSRLTKAKALYEKTSAEFDVHLDVAQDVATSVILQTATHEQSAIPPGAVFGPVDRGDFKAFTNSTVTNMATDVLRDAALARDLHRLRVAQRLSEAASANYATTQPRPCAHPTTSEVVDVEVRETATTATEVPTTAT